jgi:hypothetical protein
MIAFYTPSTVASAIRLVLASMCPRPNNSKHFFSAMRLKDVSTNLAVLVGRLRVAVVHTVDLWPGGPRVVLHADKQLQKTMCEYEAS